MFSGLVNSVKGFFGYNLEVEAGGEEEEKMQNTNSEERQSLFKQLSGFIGKDITSMISLPVWIFEPFSFLQVMCEPMQYEQVLLQAAAHPDPAYRMAFLAAFAIAGNSLAVRNKKPFNPILGETFEYVPSNKPWKFFAEQVSHHPPIGVAQVFGDAFTLLLEMQIKAKFSGNSSDVTVHGTNHFRTTKYNDHFTWGHLDTCAHNVIVGGMWIDHFGTLQIINHATGDRGVIKVTKAGWLGSGRFEVNGDIFDKDGKLRVRIFGKWNDSLYAIDASNLADLSNDKLSKQQKQQIKENHKEAATLLWKRNVNPPHKWNWSQFNDELNAIDDDYEAILPPTDSRLRSDRRALERGQTDLAGKEKHRIEEDQRAKRRAREAQNETWNPVYFKLIPEDDDKHRWEYVGNYWEQREERIKNIESSEQNETANKDESPKEDKQ